MFAWRAYRSMPAKEITNPEEWQVFELQTAHSFLVLHSNMRLVEK